jgi:hypothetical protein
MYNQLNFNNNTNFNTQGIGNNPKIIVEYNGTGIHTITGPVPVVDISYDFSNNNNNLPENITTSITLNGQIFRWPEGVVIQGVDLDKAHPGFSGIIAGVSGLRELFTSCPYGTLKFKCEDNILYEVSGLRVTNLQFDNTDNNWVQTADYRVSLEVTNSLFSGTGSDLIEQYVTDRSDTWNIEPLDDAVYTNFSRNLLTRNEYSNPYLNRESSFLQTNQTLENSILQVTNIPQFRITRRLSAKGLLPDKNIICQSELYNENTKPYVFAKTWVENMSQKGFRSTAPTNNSSPYFKNPFDQKLFAFNHNRTVNIDIFNGSYEVNDTWLAMPSGIPYTETYSIETSTGEDYIKTVRVAGNIVGLSITNNSVMTTGGPLIAGTGDSAIIDGQLQLDIYNQNGQALSTTYRNLDEPRPQGSFPPSNTISAIKYENALGAWTNHIKPFLYRRASLAINSSDRSLDYIPSYTVQPPIPPNNPIYSREGLLSTIPITSSEGHDPRKGTISYSYEYNNKLNIISGVISENISVSYTNPVDSTSETQVIGRVLGPILQRTGRSTPKKTVNIEISIPSATNINQISLNNPACPLYKNGYLFRTIEQIIEAHRPYSPGSFLNEPIQTIGLVYTSDDSEQWSPTTGKYSRSVSWIYQQANIGNDFRDH